MAAEAKFAIRLSLDGSQSVEETLRRIAASAQEAAGKVQASNAATGQSFANLGTGIQQAGYQVGDFAVQVASGQSIITAFVQQGAQLLGMFGGWKGAIAGAGLAIVGAAIHFADFKTEAERLTDALTAQEAAWKAGMDAAERYRSGLDEEEQKVRSLTTYYGTLNGARRSAEQARVDSAQQGLETSADALFSRLPGSLRSLANESDARISGTVGGLSPAMRELAQAMREFALAETPAREGLEQLLVRLNELGNSAQGREREILRAWRDELVKLVPEFQKFEEAQRQAAAQAAALRGDADGAARAITGLGAAARQEAGAFDELARGLRNANTLLEAFRSGGAAGLAAARGEIALAEQARRSREAEVRELMSRNGLSRADAEGAADERDIERTRILRETQAAAQRLAQEQALAQSREDAANAARLRGLAPQARAVETARISAEREARERNLAGLEREEFIRNRVAAAQAQQAGQGPRQVEAAGAMADAALRAAEAAEQGRGAFLRQSAAIEAARQAAQTAGLAEGALTEAIIRRNAAQAAQRGAGAILELRERLEATRAIAAAETPAAAVAAQRAEAIRQATAELRGYAEAVTDPRIKAALEAEIAAIERLRTATDAAGDAARNRAAAFRQDQAAAMQDAERRTVFSGATERARILAETRERLRLEGEGLPTEGESAEARIRRAGDLGVGEEEIRRLRDMASTAQEVGSALSEAFRAAAFEGQSLSATIDNLDKRLASIAFRALVEKPFENLLSGLAGRLVGGGSGGSGDVASGILGAILGFLPGGDGGIKAAVAHGGGIAGEGLATRDVPTSLFRGAPRYHGGGIAGLGPDEVPAILRRGERVRTIEQEAALAQGMRAPPPFVMHVHGVRDPDAFQQSRGQIGAAAMRLIQSSRRNV